jgi:hypothetical protein
VDLVLHWDKASESIVPIPEVPASLDHIVDGADASLRRLGTDYVDLLLYHRPHPLVPIADVLGEMGNLVAKGKEREIWCSNFSGNQLLEAVRVASDCGVRSFVNVQNQHNLLDRSAEQDVIPACDDLGCAPPPYSRSPAACSAASIGATNRFRLTAVSISGRPRGALPHRRRIRRHRALVGVCAVSRPHAPRVGIVLARELARRSQRCHRRNDCGTGALNVGATLAWDISDAEREEIAACSRFREPRLTRLAQKAVTWCPDTAKIAPTRSTALGRAGPKVRGEG